MLRTIDYALPGYTWSSSSLELASDYLETIKDDMGMGRHETEDDNRDCRHVASP